MERLASGTGWLGVQERGGRIAILDPGTGHNLLTWPGGDIAGGDRLWPAPEVGIFYDEDGRWRCPDELDPGSWSMHRSDDVITLTQAFEDATFHREVAPLDQPPVACDMPWVGYHVADEVTSPRGWLAWHLVVTPAPARVYVRQARGPVVYYAPAPVVSEGFIDVADEPPRFKIGFAAPADGKVLLAAVDAADPGGLVVVEGHADPSHTFVDVPPEGGPATAVQLYGSGGEGFCELEHHASVQRPRLESSVWGVWGPREQRLLLLRELRAVAETAVGPEPT